MDQILGASSTKHPGQPGYVKITAPPAWEPIAMADKTNKPTNRDIFVSPLTFQL